MPYALHKTLQNRLPGCWIMLISSARSAGDGSHEGIGISLGPNFSGMVTGKLGCYIRLFRVLDEWPWKAIELHLPDPEAGSTGLQGTSSRRGLT